MPATIGGNNAGPPVSDAREHRVRGACAELFVAGKVQAAGGHRVVVAADRVRVDAVGLLLHDLHSYCIGGLAIHSGLISPERRLAISFGATTFFVDPRLWLVILPSNRDGTFHETAFLIPSAAIQGLISTQKWPTARSDTGQQSPWIRLAVAICRSRCPPPTSAGSSWKRSSARTALRQLRSGYRA